MNTHIADSGFAKFIEAICEAILKIGEMTNVIIIVAVPILSLYGIYYFIRFVRSTLDLFFDGKIGGKGIWP